MCLMSLVSIIFIEAHLNLSPTWQNLSQISFMERLVSDHTHTDMTQVTTTCNLASASIFN